MISNEEWINIEKELSKLHGSVEFCYEKHKVKAINEVFERKVVTVIYLDGGWLFDENHENYELYCALTHKRSERLHKGSHKKVVVYTPYFSSVKTLVNQYKKLDKLNLSKIGAYEFAMKLIRI